MNLWQKIFQPNKFYDYSMIDEITGEQFSIMDMLTEMNSRVQKMQQEIHFLKEENIENSNLIYELMNSIEALDTRIDIVTAEEFLKERDRNV